MKHIKYFIYIILCFSLTGCYIPERFAFGIDIDKEGRYLIRYQGTLIASALAQKLNNGEITEQEIKEKELPIYKRDLAKIGNIERLNYIGNGRFDVSLRYIQNIQNGKYAFFRPNNKFFSLTKQSDDSIIIRGHRLPQKYQSQLDGYNVAFEAIIQLTTNATITKHNADKIQQKNGNKILLWYMQSFFEDPPIAIIRLKT